MKKPDWRKWIKDDKECKLWLDSYIKKGMLAKSKMEEKLYFAKSEHNLNFANWLGGKQEELKKLFDEALITVERNVNFDGKTFFVRFPKEITQKWDKGSHAHIKVLGPSEYLVKIEA